MTDLDAQGRYGEIYDRGYQHYLGDRLGRRHTLWALILYSMKRAMGIKKSWTAKVIPIILYLAVIGTVLVVIGIEAFVGSAGDTQMSYPDYFGFIFLIEGAFVATIAPEMLCGDRRENVLSLYFSRAISRWDYVLGKLGAVAILTMTISVVPVVLLWFFRQLLADRPLTALTDNIDELGKVVVIGALIAGYFGCLGLMISSFTGRKSIANAIIFIGYVVVEALVNSIFEVVNNETLRDYLALVSPLRLFSEMSAKMFNEFLPENNGHEGFGYPVYIVAALITILIGILVMVWRYVPED